MRVHPGQVAFRYREVTVPCVNGEHPPENARERWAEVRVRERLLLDGLQAQNFEERLLPVAEKKNRDPAIGKHRCARLRHIGPAEASDRFEVNAQVLYPRQASIRIHEAGACERAYGENQPIVAEEHARRSKETEGSRDDETVHDETRF